MRLKLQWARFFTLVNWEWKLAADPGFDFEVSFPCGHSECGGSHLLRIRVVERNQDVSSASYHERFSPDAIWMEPHPALFGDGPKNTFWEMPHGAGGGVEDVTQWVPDALRVWNQAAHG